MGYTELRDRWEYMWESRESFAFGDEDFDMEAYKDLVKETYYCIKEMQTHISNKNYADVSPEDMRDYLTIVSLISRYSASCYTDNSKDCAFAISRLLAYDLSDLATFFWSAADEEHDGEIVSFEGYSYGLDKNIVYNVNKGDLSDYIEYARRVGC